MQPVPPISQLDLLRVAKNHYDLAALIGVEVQFLTRVLYQRPYRSRYKTFEIKKKNGGVRVIEAPDKKLREIQRRLATVLYDCRDTIAETETSTMASSYGFERSRAPIHNARKHLKRRYVFNVDLKDFFPSIHIGRVKGFLMSDRNFNLNESVALLIAQIACHNGKLPQGSPLSPIISNMVAQVLDRRLRKFGISERCSYSRYADDITFSTNLREFPKSIAIFEKGQWCVAEPFEKLIKRSGFELNHLKTRMQQSHQRQIVTGLTVNSKPLPNVDYRKQTRAMCHTLFRDGKYFNGETSYDISKNHKDIRPLKGRVSFISHIAQQSKDLNSKKLCASEELQKKLIYFESFVLRQKPMILTEGITDRMYLKFAMQHKDILPKSMLTEEKQPTFDIFNPTNAKRDYLKIGDGAQQIKNFMFAYMAKKKGFEYYPGNSAIIGLLDSDKEGQHVLKALQNGMPSRKISESTISLGNNLYLVILNHNGDNKEIENYFPPKLLNEKIDNRSFDLISSKDNSEVYSKKDFAKFVVPKYSVKSDFKEFQKIFTSFSECIEHNLKSTSKVS